MEEVRKQFVVNERNRKVAVQIDIDTFNKIEDLLESYVLIQKRNLRKTNLLIYSQPRYIIRNYWRKNSVALHL